MPFTRILRRNSKWDDPQESIGELVGQFGGGRYRCWEAVGRAREVFQSLSLDISEYLEACSIPASDPVSWSIYMIGHGVLTASPKVLICCTDVKTRKLIRKLIQDSTIMSKYPGIGLGDVSSLPDRQLLRQLTKEEVENLLPEYCDKAGAVLADGPAYAVGRRIFVVSPKEYTLRPATTGPFIYHNGTCYQLTAAHVFQFRPEQAGLPEPPAPLEDCDFDGMSEGEDGDAHTSDEEMTGRGSITPEDIGSQRGSFTGNLDPEDLAGSMSSSPSPTASRRSSSLRSDTAPRHIGSFRSGPLFPKIKPDLSKLRYFGNIALSSDTSSKQSLDYALIEVDNQAAETMNIIRPPGVKAGTIKIDTVGKVASDDIDVLVLVPSRGPLTGRLRATPTFFRAPGQATTKGDQDTFRKVYPVRVDGTALDGDCGAAVIDRHSGNFYGHVIAGGLESSIMYVVPADDIMRDIEARLGDGVALTPQPKATAFCTPTKAKGVRIVPTEAKIPTPAPSKPASQPKADPHQSMKPPVPPPLRPRSYYGPPPPAAMPRPPSPNSSYLPRVSGYGSLPTPPDSAPSSRANSGSTPQYPPLPPPPPPTSYQAPSPFPRQGPPAFMRNPPPPPPPPTQAIRRQGPVVISQNRPPTVVSDIRQEFLTEPVAREYLESYSVFRFKKADQANEYGVDSKTLESTWEHCVRTELVELSKREIVRKIRDLDRDKKSFTEKKADLKLPQLRQLDVTLDGLNRSEPDPRFVWTLVQIDDEREEIERQDDRSGDKKSAKTRSGKSHKKRKYRRISITGYYKRSLRPTYSGITVYRSSRSLPGGGVPIQPGGVGPATGPSFGRPPHLQGQQPMQYQPPPLYQPFANMPRQPMQQPRNQMATPPMGSQPFVPYNLAGGRPGQAPQPPPRPPLQSAQGANTPAIVLASPGAKVSFAVTPNHRRRPRRVETSSKPHHSDLSSFSEESDTDTTSESDADSVFSSQAPRDSGKSESSREESSRSSESAPSLGSAPSIGSAPSLGASAGEKGSSSHRTVPVVQFVADPPRRMGGRYAPAPYTVPPPPASMSRPVEYERRERETYRMRSGDRGYSGSGPYIVPARSGTGLRDAARYERGERERDRLRREYGSSRAIEDEDFGPGTLTQAERVRRLDRLAMEEEELLLAERRRRLEERSSREGGRLMFDGGEPVYLYDAGMREEDELRNPFAPRTRSWRRESGYEIGDRRESRY